MTRFRRALAYAPAAGVLAFSVLYAAGAWLYPGGSQVDRTHPGFHLSHNYFCDLLRPIAYDGRPNAGRGAGLVAMALIVPTLALFWQLVVRLYPSERVFGVATRVAGAISAAATFLLVTPFHDSAVELGGAFGLVAFFSTLFGLARAGHERLFGGGVAAAAVSSACFVIWKTGYGLPVLAGLQKLAFALFLAWVFVASLATARARDGRETAVSGPARR